jgi:site-specific DNA recombinase
VKRCKPYRIIRRVAIYLRVSSDEQLLGHSMDSQTKALLAWAKMEGWEVVEIYADAGVSGTSVERRPEFRRMMADAQAGKFDAILVLKIDRFARSLRDSTIYGELLRDCGVRLLSRTEPNAGDDTPAAFLMNGQADLYAAYYSIQLSDNVARGKATRAAKGLPLGDLPFGYVSAGPQEPPTIVSDEAEQIRRCFRGYAAGNRSMAELAQSLNAAGFRPRSKRGRAVFSKATLSGMLSNPTYVGDVTRHGQFITSGHYEPIIGRELWDAVQRARRERASKPQMHARRSKRAYLLSGVGCCVTCGSPLWANTINGGKHNYYRCASRQRGDECADGRVGHRADPVEAHVHEVFSELAMPPAWRERVAELAQHDDKGRDVEAERRRLTGKIGRIRQGLVDGVLENDEAKEAMNEAEAALAVLASAGCEPARAGEVLTDVRELWPHMSDAERRDLVQLVLAKVVVDLRTGEMRAMTPKPAFSTLFAVLGEYEGGLIRVCDWRPRRDSNPRSPP